MENIIKMYDDPYVMSAYSLVANHNYGDLKRILTEDDFVKKIVSKELRLTDFRGTLIDAIVQELLEDKRRMDVMRALDEFSSFFYDNLDLLRLRKEVWKAICRLGLTYMFDNDFLEQWSKLL